MATHRYYQLQNSLSRGVIWEKLARQFSFKVRFSDILPFVFYNLFWLPFKVILDFFFRIEVDSKEDLKNLEGPLIIASSHASWTDSFIIGICFSFCAKVCPIRYAVLWKYYYFPPFTLLLWLSGNFPIRKGLGLDKSLAAPIEILKKGGCVGIFPTGKRTRLWHKEAPKPKRGVVYLSAKTRVPILPIKIEGNLGMKFRRFLLRKYRIKVKIGKLCKVSIADLQDENQLNLVSDSLMRSIMSL